jgi:hypothetical protein
MKGERMKGERMKGERQKGVQRGSCGERHLEADAYPPCSKLQLSLVE